MNFLLLNHLIGFGLLVGVLTPLVVYVYLKNSSSVVNRSFALCFGSTAWWAFWTLFLITAPSSQLGLLWDKLCLSGVVFIPSAFFEFCVSYLGLRLQWRQAIRLNYMASLIFLWFLWGTDLFVKGVAPKFGLNYFTVPGPVYLIFVSMFLTTAYWAIGLIWLKLRATKPSAEQTKLAYFFWFSLIAFTAGACNYLLVYDINIPGLAETSNYGVLIYALAIAWIIFRYQFLDITAVIKRSVVYSLLVACIVASYLLTVVTMKWFQYALVPSGLLSFAINCSLGIFVYLKNRHNSLNRFFAIFALSVGCWSVGSSLENMISDEVSALRTLRLCYIFASFLPTFFLHFSLILTKQVSRRTILRAAYAVSTLLAALTATPHFISGLRVIDPYGFRISDPGPVYYIFFAFFATCLVYGLRLIYQKMKTTLGTERRQLQYIFLSHVIAASAGLEYFTRVFRLVDLPPVDDYILVIYFMVFAYAIMRHRLLDIQVVIRRSVVYSLLIACITAAYLVMVLAMERWFQGFLGYRSIFSTAVVAFLIAVFFNPLRDRIQAFVDRALFKATPAEMAAQREQLLAEVRKGEQMKAVATLAAGLAHEIKNPLASIKTFTEYLATRHNDPEFRAKFQKIVGGEVERINLIVQQLLEFAKPVPPKLQPLDIPHLVDETLEFLNNEFVQHHVEVGRRYETRERILGDPQQLKQVFLNLFLNSLQAMNGLGQLEVQTAVRGAELLVTVSDNGSGIAPKDLPHIFEPFYTTKTNGTGLGLAVVQGIVKEHGGRIDVESHPGQGTAFKLFLPIAI